MLRALALSLNVTLNVFGLPKQWATKYEVLGGGGRNRVGKRVTNARQIFGSPIKVMKRQRNRVQWERHVVAFAAGRTAGTGISFPTVHANGPEHTSIGIRFLTGLAVQRCDGA